MDLPFEFDWVHCIQDLDQTIDPLFIILAVLSTSEDEGTDVRQEDGVASVGFPNV
jgi:hypothetical protein